MDLIHSTYARAGLSLNETGQFEAHRTGTPIGDPLELSALGSTFGTSRSDDDPPLYVSSVKTNIGHTEDCSAIAGIIKAILCIEKGLIAPNADFESLNPKLRLVEWRLALPLETTPWPSTYPVRRVSVNSFGYGDSNGYVILDDPYSYLHSHQLDAKHSTVPPIIEDHDFGVSSASSVSEEQTSLPEKKIFVFSTFDQAGLQRQRQSYAQFLSKHDQPESEPKNDLRGFEEQSKYLADLAHTLVPRRKVFDYRTFAVASSLKELSNQLEKDLPTVARASAASNAFFVFTGQGAQWPKMGSELLSNPVFRKSIENSQQVLDKLGCTWNMAEFLKNGDKRIDQPEFSQTICTVVQLALVGLFDSWGIRPQAVCGHSPGEIAAAHVAGAFSQEDAVKIAYFRGLFSSKVAERMKVSPVV